MARLSAWLACIHHFLIQVPQHGYHNISRVIQPQIRSISESFIVSGSRSNKDIELQPLKPKQPTSKGEATKMQVP